MKRRETQRDAERMSKAPETSVGADRIRTADRAERTADDTIGALQKSPSESTALLQTKEGNLADAVKPAFMPVDAYTGVSNKRLDL